MNSNSHLVLLGFFAGTICGVFIENRVLNRADHAAFAAASLVQAYSLTSSPRSQRSEKSKIEAAVPAAKSSLAPPTAASTASVDRKRPKIAIEQAVYKFGERESGETVEHIFTVKNTGTENLNISRVIPACGCTVAKLSTNNLAPGQEAQVNVKLNLARQKGPQNREIVLQTNDPDSPATKLALVGNAVPRIKLLPERVQINEPADSLFASATVKIATERGLKFNVVNQKTSDESVTASVAVIKPGEEFEVTITLKPPFSPGDIQGWVHLMTDQQGEYGVVAIPIAAHFADNSAAPQVGGSDTNAPSTAARARRVRGVQVGEQFTFAGPALDGVPIDDTQYKGKPVVIAFWASWCGICKREMPKLIEIHEKYHARGLEVVGISLDRKKEVLEQYINENNVPWPNIYFDPEAGNGNPLAQKYKVGGVPWFVLLNRDGKVVTNDARGPALDAAVAALISEDPAVAESEAAPADTTAAPAGNIESD